MVSEIIPFEEEAELSRDDLDDDLEGQVTPPEGHVSSQQGQGHDDDDEIQEPEEEIIIDLEGLFLFACFVSVELHVCFCTFSILVACYGVILNA